MKRNTREPELNPRLLERFLALKMSPAENLVFVRDLLRRCARNANGQEAAALEPTEAALLQRVKAKIAALAAELCEGEIRAASLDELEKLLGELPAGALAEQVVILATLAFLNVQLEDLGRGLGLEKGEKSA
jgi:hypothetical protein